jgi:uncharacterized protein (TIGR02145 family)
MNTDIKIAFLPVLLLFFGCEPESEPPPPLTTPNVSTSSIRSLTFKSASGGGDITSDGGAQVNSRGICWSTSNNPTINDEKTTNGSGTGSFASYLTNLSPDTKYYVRAYATNSKGTAYGSVVSFTTLHTFTDTRDGQGYNLVKIGDQIWMAENLAYLPRVDLPSSVSSSSPRYYVYGYDGTNVSEAKSSSNYITYGVLYNWPAAMNNAGPSNTNPSGIRGVCPADWHLPSTAEWQELFDFLGNESNAGASMKETGTDHWAAPNTGANNQSGFTAFPGGLRYFGGEFDAIGLKSYWWSTQGVQYSGADVFGNYYNDIVIHEWNVDVGYGISVRCVNDD